MTNQINNYMKLQKTTLISLLLLILIMSSIVGHFLPPTGILAAPVIIVLISGLIVFTNNDFNILVKSLLAYLFIGLNDIGIKLFAGGMHDMEGVGWINMMFLIGSAISFIILLIGILKDRNSTNGIKALSALIFIVLICIHCKTFETLGVNVN